jgi:hypothetical protein
MSPTDRPRRRLGPRSLCRLACRADTLLAVAPKLRTKRASKLIDLFLAEIASPPVQAARQASMTAGAAGRLLDRLVLLGVVRELSGRPAFRLYGQ